MVFALNRLWNVLIGLALMAWPSAAVAGDLIPRKLIFGNPERSSALVSPDGGRIAYLAPVGGVMNVMVAPANAIANAKPVTQEKIRPVRMFQWAANGVHILYLQDEGGDENYHLFAANTVTGAIANLTPFPAALAEIMAVSHARPNEILAGINNRDPKWHDVWRFDLTTGKGALAEKNEGMAGYVADANLKIHLALKSTPDGGMDILKRQGAGWTRAIAIPAGDALTTYPVAISGDGRTLTMIDSRGRDKAALISHDLQTGASALLGQNAKADVSETIADPMTKRVLAFAAEYDKAQWSAVDPTLKPTLDDLRRKVPGRWDLLSQSMDNRFWTLRVDNVAEPVKFALYDRKAKALQPLFTGRPALTGAPLSPMHSRMIAARDGLNMVSYLTLPRAADPDGDGKPVKPLPMVLNVHGGPWARDSFGYDPEHQWLANRGYAVLSVNFRGSTGFGKGFVNAADREWAGKMHDDLIDAVNWAVAQGVAAPDRIAIYGGSYGGYAALVGVTFTPKTFACGVSIVGPSNLNTLLASIPPYWASFLDTFKRRVGDPATAEGRAMLAARSPLFKADRIERPLLIAQGANDPRVKQAESDQIVAAMRAKNIPVTYVLYADEGHGFARPENRMSFYAVSEAFLAKCLGGGHQPIGGDFAGSSIAVPTGQEHVQGLSEALGAASR